MEGAADGTRSAVHPSGGEKSSAVDSSSLTVAPGRHGGTQRLLRSGEHAWVIVDGDDIVEAAQQRLGDQAATCADIEQAARPSVWGRGDQDVGDLGGDAGTVLTVEASSSGEQAHQESSSSRESWVGKKMRSIGQVIGHQDAANQYSLLRNGPTAGNPHRPGTRVEHAQDVAGPVVSDVDHLPQVRCRIASR